MKKKNYNPFKMWGSYVGTIVGLMYQFFSQDIVDFFGFTFNFTSSTFTFSIGYTIIGFLIGWGIHSLFRRFK